MIRAWLSDRMSDPGFAVEGGISMILFLLLFVGVLVWIYRPGSRNTYEQEAALPFEDGARSETTDRESANSAQVHGNA